MSALVALDLFAGSGWGVACQRLGIEEVGVEIMPEAVATRTRAGMRTAFGDVWHGLMPSGDAFPFMAMDFVRDLRPGLVIGSPPCPTFSISGKGEGRRALDSLLRFIDRREYMSVARLRAFEATGDPRTALVLTPLAYVHATTPTYVVLEQVPPALPVWERYAEEMRRWGYSVWTGILNAEQYGVPQTRRRAILIARADGVEAAPPAPTHSRYYSHEPARLDDGVLPWVSMAAALGWDEDERVGFARRADDKGAATPDGYRARDLRPASAPAHHLTEKARSWTRTRPATTISGDSRVWAPGHKVNASDVRRLGDEAARGKYGDRAGTTAIRVTVAEAAALQSYPTGFEFAGTQTKQFLQIGNAVPPLLGEAILKAAIS